MPSTEIQTLETRAAHLREKIDKCADIIKQLSGEKPDSFTFTFSIRSVVIVSFEIGEEEANFNLSYFMSWHQFYRNELKAITEQLAVA